MVAMVEEKSPAKSNGRVFGVLVGSNLVKNGLLDYDIWISGFSFLLILHKQRPLYLYRHHEQGPNGRHCPCMQKENKNKKGRGLTKEDKTYHTSR